MFFFLILVYFLSLLFVLFDFNILFVNEEFLIFICMSILFFLIFTSARKFVNFSFFLRIEFIYFFFIYLIILNVKLIEKMLNLVSLENFKLDTLIIAELYSFFSESVNELASSEKLINLFLTKNIVLLINSNVFSSFILPFSSDFTTKYALLNGDVLQQFELRDLNQAFVINKININTTAKSLVSSVLYDLYNTGFSTTPSINVNSILDNTDLNKIASLEDLDLLVEAVTFNNNLILSLTK